MIYQEMTIEEAMKVCDKKTKVLVAIQNLEEQDADIVFIQKKRSEYKAIFSDVKTVASLHDDFVKQLRCFTEKQDIMDIKPIGVLKIVLIE